ncbi:MAG TPA: helix-turn-helix transcriptional regulator [Polyangia bacterium]|nr:helix-turn-helix transcriptional regulator [Polyangia bacterium]
MTDDQDQREGAPEEENVDAESIDVEPSVLVWARKSIGLDEARAAKKIGVVPGTLHKWETRETAPTLRQLRKAAAAYKRPLAVLLLSEPAKDFDALRDFRAGPRRRAEALSPELTAEYWRAMSPGWPRSTRTLALDAEGRVRPGAKLVRPLCRAGNRATNRVSG